MINLLLLNLRPPISTLFPYTTLFRSASIVALRRKDRDSEVLYRAKPNLSVRGVDWPLFAVVGGIATGISFLVILVQNPDRKSTRLNSSHPSISYAVFCLKKKNNAFTS